MSKHLAILTLATLSLAACEQNDNPTDPGPAATEPSLRTDRVDDDRDDGAGPRAVYTLTNQLTGNAVAVFARATDGKLTPAGTFPTGGTGTGAGLGSQGAIGLSEDGAWLLAVNAGSNDVTVFRVGPGTLSATSRTRSGGTTPISLTVSGNLVYVLNAGAAGNITGFTLTRHGELTPIAGSARSLSGAGTQPAQVSFTPDGRQLIVTEKGTNLLDVFPVNFRGVAGERTSVQSAGGTPFGFAFGPRSLLFVTEAAGAGSASSYLLNRQGEPRVVSSVVATNQGAPCWAVITGDGRFGYSGNGSGSVSAFTIARDGSIRLLDASGATAVVAGGVNDVALSHNSRFLYVLGVGGTRAIHGYRVKADGHLEELGPVGDFPAGTSGLAAR
jgi:6-phosphogluconolactonase (cycloisomerase 2 family)